MMSPRLATRRLLIASFLIVSASVARGEFSTDGPSDADRAPFAALAREIAARLDALDALRQRRAEAEQARDQARALLSKLERTAEVAEISVKEYLDGLYPQDKQTIESEIKLAESELARAKDRLEWSERMKKKGAVGDSQVLADRMAKQKAEICLSNARQKMVVLEQYTKVKQQTELEASVKKARDEMASAREDFRRSEAALVALDRQIADEDLTEGESRAVIRLDESLTKLEAGRVDEARAGLAEARTLWDAAKAARERARFDALRARIRRAADQARGRKTGG